MRRRSRTVTVVQPAREGRLDGLAYALFVPEGPAAGGVVVLHGAGSCKENHFDFARACLPHRLAAVCFDQRGHGESHGALGGTALDDVAAVARLLPEGPVALRGSSMGGWLAIAAARRVGARAVVAICPAPASLLRRALAEGRFDFRADAPALDALLAEHDDLLAAGTLDVPLLLLHAEGDEQVPVEHSRALAERAPRSRLVAVPGGHHRSVQHDPELRALALRFLARSLNPAGRRA